MSKVQLLESLRTLGIVEKRDVQLKYGGSSSVYINMKKALGYPELVKQMSALLWGLGEVDPTCVVGSGHGGITLASALSLEYSIPLSLIRDKQKDHGLHQLIDGYMPQPYDRILIVDDVVTTGGSILSMLETLQKTSARIIGCSVVLQRGNVNLDVPLHSIFSLADIYEEDSYDNS